MDLGFLGDVGGAVLGFLGQQSANKANAEAVAQSNAMALHLASSQYQRAVTDLKQAGLNPMMAYQNGGAAVPPVQTPTIQNSVGAGISSGLGLFERRKAAELIDSQKATQETQQAVNKALALKAGTEAELNAASAAEVRARTPMYGPQITKILAEVDKIAAETKLSFAQAVKVKQDALNAVLQGDLIKAETGNVRADMALTTLNHFLRLTEVPAAEAKRNFAETWWGQHMSPLLGDIGIAAGVARDVGIAGGALRPRVTKQTNVYPGR